jgi:hypothetical protein
MLFSSVFSSVSGLTQLAQNRPEGFPKSVSGERIFAKQGNFGRK